MTQNSATQRLIWFGEALLVAMLCAGLMSVIMGMGLLVGSFWPMIWGHDFAGEPIWQFLGLKESYHEILQTDRSWWFILVLPVVLFALGSGLSDHIKWLSLTPEKRTEAKRRAAKAQRDLSEKARLKKIEKKELRKAKRKPMSGWKRLWLVLSVVFGVPVFALTYDERSEVYVTIEPDSQVSALSGQAFWDALYRQSLKEDSSTRGCIIQTARMEPSYGGYYSIRCDRHEIDVIIYSLLIAILPALFMWLVGGTVRWVYRGFRPQSRE